MDLFFPNVLLYIKYSFFIAWMYDSICPLNCSFQIFLTHCPCG